MVSSIGSRETVFLFVCFVFLIKQRNAMIGFVCVIKVMIMKEVFFLPALLY